MENPANLKYTKSDEWALLEGNIVTLGITDFAQDQLSDIVYVEFLVEEGDEIAASSAIVTLESVKAASDVYTPIAGKVVAVNENLADAPDSINTDAFNAWFIKIEVGDPSALDALMDSAAYTKFTEERAH